MEHEHRYEEEQMLEAKWFNPRDETTWPKATRRRLRCVECGETTENPVDYFFWFQKYGVVREI
jgi:hypothetical protein